MKIFVVLAVFESGLPYQDFLCVTKTKEEAIINLDDYFLNNESIHLNDDYWIIDNWHVNKKYRNDSMYSIHEVEI